MSFLEREEKHFEVVKLVFEMSECVGGKGLTVGKVVHVPSVVVEMFILKVVKLG